MDPFGLNPWGRDRLFSRLGFALAVSQTDSPAIGIADIIALGIGVEAVLQFSKYNKKGPLWDAPGMPGWVQKKYEQDQSGVFTPPPNFKKGDWWKKIVWALGKLAEAFHKD